MFNTVKGCLNMTNEEKYQSCHNKKKAPQKTFGCKKIQTAYISNRKEKGKRRFLRFKDSFAHFILFFSSCKYFTPQFEALRCMNHSS